MTSIKCWYVAHGANRERALTMIDVLFGIDSTEKCELPREKKPAFLFDV